MATESLTERMEARVEALGRHGELEGDGPLLLEALRALKARDCESALIVNRREAHTLGDAIHLYRDNPSLFFTPSGYKGLNGSTDANLAILGK